MRRMACGATHARTDVFRVLAEAGLLHHVGQAVAFSAKRTGTIHRQVGIRNQVRGRLSRSRGLAEFVAALQDVRPPRSMRATRTGASEFAVIVAIVAISAEDLAAHHASLGSPVQVPHIGKQAGLGESTAAWMGDWMA